MKWLKLYHKIGNQPMSNTRTKAIYVLLEDSTTETQTKGNRIDLSKEESKIALELKFDKHGVPYFTPENGKKNRKKITKWMKLYYKIGNQPMRNTRSKNVYALLEDSTTEAEKEGQIDLSKEENKTPLELKFDKYGVPYFVLENSKK